MKITLEEEIDGMDRKCLAVYDGDSNLISSCWLDREDDAYTIMPIIKKILEPIVARYAGIKGPK
jgi:hypothetical protein